MKKYEITEKFKDVFNKWRESLEIDHLSINGQMTGCLIKTATEMENLIEDFRDLQTLPPPVSKTR